MLPAIADALGGRTTLLMDGGIRRGTDVLKAVALGADAVMAGRALLWGLACGGQAGAETALRILREELGWGWPCLASRACRNSALRTSVSGHRKACPPRRCRQKGFPRGQLIPRAVSRTCRTAGAAVSPP